MLIIDEAQDLTDELLEQVRLLSNLETDNRKLLQIILLGQPELRDRLNNHRLRQLRQRITVRYHLPPLSRQEVGQYVQHRLHVSGGNGTPYFTRPALWRICQYSQGIPRLVNAVCDKALLAGFVQQPEANRLPHGRPGRPRTRRINQRMSLINDALKRAKEAQAADAASIRRSTSPCGPWTRRSMCPRRGPGSAGGLRRGCAATSIFCLEILHGQRSRGPRLAQRGRQHPGAPAVAVQPAPRPAPVPHPHPHRLPDPTNGRSTTQASTPLRNRLGK